MRPPRRKTFFRRTPRTEPTDMGYITYARSLSPPEAGGGVSYTHTHTHVPSTVRKILAVLCGVVDIWHWYSPASDGRGFFSRTIQSSLCGGWNASKRCKNVMPVANRFLATLGRGGKLQIPGPAFFLWAQSVAISSLGPRSSFSH